MTTSFQQWSSNGSVMIGSLAQVSVRANATPKSVPGRDADVHWRGTDRSRLKTARCCAQVTEHRAQAWHSGPACGPCGHRKPAAVTQAGYAYCQLRITELSVQSRRGHGPRSDGPGIFRSRPMLGMLRFRRSRLHLFGFDLAQFGGRGADCRACGLLARLFRRPGAAGFHRARRCEFSPMLMGIVLAGFRLA